MLDLQGVAVVLADDLAEPFDGQDKVVLITGLHGGLGPARAVLRHPPRLAVFNDAGVGKDGAGVAGLELLAAFRVAALTVAADSARIGDSEDALAHGVISFVNEPAAAMGLVAGVPLREALASLAR